MSLKTLYHRLREVDTPVLLVVKDDKGYVSITKGHYTLRYSMNSLICNRELGIYLTFLCQKIVKID